MRIFLIVSVLLLFSTVSEAQNVKRELPTRPRIVQEPLLQCLYRKDLVYLAPRFTFRIPEGFKELCIPIEDAKRLYELRRQQIQTEGIMPPYVAQHQRRLSGRLS